MQVDDFKVLKMIGKGGFSDVFLAEDFKENKYALKIIRPQEGKVTERMIETMKKECTIMEILSEHPNILNVNIFEEEGICEYDKNISRAIYLALEY